LKKEYTVSCASSGECNDAVGLTCPSSTGICNCPVTSIPIFCDCQRLVNSEYYWNGSSCNTAKPIDQTCTNSSTNYMCQTLTQGTICSNTSGSYKCECAYLKYYNYITNFCSNQLSVNAPCSYDSQCQPIKELTCVNGICR
jgi:hypothetical protein